MEDFDTLREQACALRRTGKSGREIKEELGLSANWDLNRLLDGEPPPEWTKRPNAKDDLRESARQLRGEGWTYDEIVAELGVTKSSVSLWVRDVSTPVLEERLAQRKAEGEARRLEALDAWQKSARRERNIERQQTKFAAAQEIGDLRRRELLMLGATAYWCEGAKDKAHRRCERVDFINSDPNLIRLFLRFLEAAEVGGARIQFRLHIHETADVWEATDYWAAVVGVDVTRFRKPVIKRHNPKTTRKNRTGHYRGCLQVGVLQSAELYRKIEGWAFGAMLGEVRSEEPEIIAGSGNTAIPPRLRLWRRPRNPVQ